MATQQAKKKSTPDATNAGGSVGAGDGRRVDYTPTLRTYNFTSVPRTMRAERRWVCYRKVQRDGKETKLPFQVNGAAASVTEPTTWCTYEVAAAAAPSFDGIGFVLGDGWAGLDLDHHAPNGEPDEFAREFVEAVESYTEISPSGDGLHVIIKGKLPDTDIPSNPLGAELYDGERYFTVTGRHLRGTPTEPQERTAEIATVYTEIRRRLALLTNPFAQLLTPAAALAGHQPQPADWLIQDMIECGDLAMVVGKAGDMKSLFIMVSMARVALGENFLTRRDGSGGLATKQGAVLWLNADNSERTHQERMVAALRSLGTFEVPFYSITTTDFELVRPEHIRWLHDVLNECQAKVLVIDTLSGVLPGIEENSAKEMTTPAANLRALANAGLTVIVLHHPPKNDVNGSRGSSVLEGKVDRRFTLSRDGDLLTLKPAKERGRPKPPIVALAALESHPITEALTGLTFFDGRADLADRRQTANEQKILDALEAGELSKNQIKTATKLSWADMSAALGELLLAHQVQEKDGPRSAKLYRKV